MDTPRIQSKILYTSGFSQKNLACGAICFISFAYGAFFSSKNLETVCLTLSVLRLSHRPLVVSQDTFWPLCVWARSAKKLVLVLKFLRNWLKKLMLGWNLCFLNGHHWLYTTTQQRQRADVHVCIFTCHTPKLCLTDTRLSCVCVWQPLHCSTKGCGAVVAALLQSQLSGLR